MTSRDFCYWLMGYIEIQDASRAERPAGLTEEQRTVIKNHLNLVFVHEIDGPDPEGREQAAHDGTKPATPVKPSPKWPPTARC